MQDLFCSLYYNKTTIFFLLSNLMYYNKLKYKYTFMILILQYILEQKKKLVHSKSQEEAAIVLQKREYNYLP